MYVARTRKLGDNPSTLTSSAKPVAAPMAQSLEGVDSAKDLLHKADEASGDAGKQRSGAPPVAKACLAALDALKAPKLSARAKKLAELDSFYDTSTGAKKVVTDIVATSGNASDKASKGTV